MGVWLEGAKLVPSAGRATQPWLRTSVCPSLMGASLSWASRWRSRGKPPRRGDRRSAPGHFAAQKTNTNKRVNVQKERKGQHYIQQIVEEVPQLPPRMLHKAIQVHICKTFRSKANQTKDNLVNQMTSQFKIKHDVNSNPSRPSINVLSKIVKQIEQSDSDTSYTPFDEPSSSIKSSPRSYIGIPLNCYYLVYFIQEQTGILFNHILLCLKKLEYLSYPSNIFFKNIPLIASVMRPFIVSLDRELIKKMLPMALRHKYHKVSCLIDCLEIEVQKPSKPNTIKYLISCTPNSLVNYISYGYGGLITDTCIVETSDFSKCLQPNMCVMVDRGFKHVEVYLRKMGVLLVRPPSVVSGAKLTKAEAKETKQIASLRIHIERVIRRLREFNMLKPHACLNLSLVKVLDDVITIACCGLINIQDSLIK
ncbi:hypothetical protein ABMA28_003121 [Loxostege sticticalis]|uniref:DDE Tnp4 domain-containing protein n=1 Tax=Loxostege sticticalis TaxID=481309 RepID=A0ABD0SZG7_LOXSC